MWSWSQVGVSERQTQTAQLDMQFLLKLYKGLVNILSSDGFVYYLFISRLTSSLINSTNFDTKAVEKIYY